MQRGTLTQKSWTSDCGIEGGINVKEVKQYKCEHCPNCDVKMEVKSDVER